MALTGSTPTQLCRCGHIEATHQHYRGGTDCGYCGRHRCPAYRPRGPLAQTIHDIAVWVRVVRWTRRAWRDLGR